MLIDSRTIYAAKLNLRVPVRLQAKKCPLLANTYCTCTDTRAAVAIESKFSLNLVHLYTGVHVNLALQ